MDFWLCLMISFPVVAIGYGFWIAFRYALARKEIVKGTRPGVVLFKRYYRGSDGNPRTFASIGRNGNLRVGLSQGRTRAEEYRIAILLDGGETVNVHDPRLYALIGKGRAVIVETTTIHHLDRWTGELLYAEFSGARILEVRPETMQVAS